MHTAAEFIMGSEFALRIAQAAIDEFEKDGARMLWL
jgi:hypothetical protein